VTNTQQVDTFEVEEELARRMDRLPLSRAHIRTILIAGFGPFFESFDQNNIIYVLPALLGPLALSSGQAGVVASAATYGMAIGCFMAGPLADKYGRKRVFQYFLVWFSLWSGLSAVAWDFPSLVVIRFLLGIGLGGELPVGVSLISELLPKSGRRLLPLYQSFFAFGQIAAAGVALVLVPTSASGWRLVFLVGLVPALYAAVLRRSLPESPRWLARTGKLEEARNSVRYFEDSSEAGGATLRAVSPGTVGPDTARPTRNYTFVDLFRGKYARRTGINTLYWVMLWLGTGANGLLYVMLVQEGFSLETTLVFGVAATLASAPGYWASAYLLEAVGRRTTLFLYAVLSGVAYFVVVHTVDPTLLLITLLAINFTTVGSIGAVYTYLSEQYPTEIRATAVAWVNVFSRIALASGSVITGFLISLVGPQNAFTLSGLALALAGVVLLVFGIETRGKTLEEIQALA
jgi:MFS transporter, putative metabolite:H+ symporter